MKILNQRYKNIELVNSVFEPLIKALFIFKMKKEGFTIKDKQAKAEFGTQFSSNAEKGDLFVRVDSLPNKLYRFNGETWIEIPKDNTTTYLTNEEYIEYLVNELAAGRIDVNDLTQKEQEEVTKVLKT